MKLHETRSVNIPARDVFAYTADFSNIDQWDPGVVSSTKVGNDPAGVGSTYELEVKFGSSLIPMTYEITEFFPDSRVVIVGTGETLDAVDVIEFTERDGVTRIDYTADLTFHYFFRFVAPIASPLMKRVGTKALDGLVGALES